MTDSAAMASPEVISDPVAHISISGVHGGDELNDRIAQAEHAPSRVNAGDLRTLLMGVAIGLVAGIVIGRGRRPRSSRIPLTTP